MHPKSFCRAIRKGPLSAAMQIETKIVSSSDKFEWLHRLNFNLGGLAPHLKWPSSSSYAPPTGHPISITASSSGIWDSFTLAPIAAVNERCSANAFASFVPQSGKCVSGVAHILDETINSRLGLDVVRPSTLRDDFWPSKHKVGDFFFFFFLRDFTFKKTLFEKLQYLKQEQ